MILSRSSVLQRRLLKVQLVGTLSALATFARTHNAHGVANCTSTPQTHVFGCQPQPATALPLCRARHMLCVGCATILRAPFCALLQREITHLRKLDTKRAILVKKESIVYCLTQEKKGACVDELRAIRFAFERPDPTFLKVVPISAHRWNSLQWFLKTGTSGVAQHATA